MIGPAPVGVFGAITEDMVDHWINADLRNAEPVECVLVCAKCGQPLADEFTECCGTLDSEYIYVNQNGEIVGVR
jgi:hypothetical protein